MSNRSDISAGKAFVELYLKRDQFIAGLGAVADTLKTVGDGISSAGLKIGAVGAAIVAPFEAARLAVKNFDAHSAVLEKIFGLFSEGGKEAFGRVRNAIFELLQAMAEVAKPTQDAKDQVAGLATTFHDTIRGITRFVRDNKAMLQQLLSMARTAVLVGGALFGIGKAVSFAGVAIKTLMPVVGFLLTPFGALTAVLVAGVAAWATWTKSGQTAVTEIRDAFRQSWQGIRDAIASGDFRLAAQIAWAGIVLAFQAGTLELSKIWNTVKHMLRTVWNEAATNMATVWFTMLEKLELAWINTIAFLRTTWNALSTFILSKQNEWAKAIGDKIIMAARAVGLVSKEFADAWSDALKSQTEQTARDLASGSGEVQREADESRAKRSQELRERTKTLNDILQQNKGMEQDRINDELDAAVKQKQQALDDARARLKELTEQAAEQAKAARVGQAPDAPFGRGGNVIGSFFSAAVAALTGGSGSVEMDILKEVKKQKEQQAEQLKVQKEQLKAQQAMRIQFVA